MGRKRMKMIFALVLSFVISLGLDHYVFTRHNPVISEEAKLAVVDLPGSFKRTTTQITTGIGDFIFPKGQPPSPAPFTPTSQPKPPVEGFPTITPSSTGVFPRATPVETVEPTEPRSSPTAPFFFLPTSAPPTWIPPTWTPPTSVPPTSRPPTSVPPTAVPPTAVPPTVVPPTSPPSPVTKADFAKCLTAAGMKVYTIQGCGNCSYQKTLFGSAWSYIAEVDCETHVQECGQVGVSGLPGWARNGHLVFSGPASFKQLSQLSGCPAP